MFGLYVQRLHLNLVLACSFLFKLCFCWTLCTVGMTSGWDMMSSSGQLLFFLFLQVLFLSNICCVVTFFTCFRYVALLVVSLVCYVATFSFAGILFYLFTPSGQDCGLNMFFIVITLIFAFLFAIVTLHPTVSALPLSLIFLIGHLSYNKIKCL